MLAAFVTVLTEALPAGVLVAMSADLGVSEAATGQTVTVYAMATALTAIPLSLATATWRRKRLLLCGVAGFAIGNTITALSTAYPLTLAGRAAAGVAAGIVWALLAGYARRMAPPGLQGRAIAIVMAGIPLALALGIPAGTFLGRVVGWQVTFLVMSGLAVLLLAWIAAVVPDVEGDVAASRMPLLPVLRVPGVTAVLAVTLIFVLAHNILYTYIATLLERVGMSEQIDVVLLAFGVAAIVSIFVVGATIDRHLRSLAVLSTLLVAAGVTLLAVQSGSPFLVYLAIGLWGLGWGGVPTLLQTAAGTAGREHADLVLAMLVTLWNLAMATGGAVGGALLVAFGPSAFAWVVVAMLVPSLWITLSSRVHGFPAPGAPAERPLRA
jgi:predicted MFS family arabinose efflux permease